jgi:hypothetical protein
MRKKLDAFRRKLSSSEKSPVLGAMTPEQISGALANYKI